MNTIETLQQAIKKELGRDLGTLTKDTSFEELALDSLDVVQMVMAIEEAFDIEIDDDDVENLKTVGQLLDYIEARK
ncbi:MAG: acyl carrier protein [Peptococcaceae bacterium]|jgi:acyl carrier protein|nr:acyl carrier protein [Peptococcaceae bacterium]